MNDELTKGSGAGVDPQATHIQSDPQVAAEPERHPDPSATNSAAPGSGASQPPAETSLPPGGILPGTLLVNTYRVERLLGGGGMGEVYLAQHAGLGSLHAVKVIRPSMAANHQVMDLFYREAKVLRGVHHDAIVSYEGFVRDAKGRDYLVMEFVEGASLAERLHQGPLAPDEVMTLRDRLAAGLAEAHRRGAIHRDISPDNVIMPGERVENAKLIDFGLSKLTDPTQQTIIGDSFAGKLRFAAPEQFGMFGGAVDARTDIYSLGLVLAAVALGRPLDMGNNFGDAMRARLTVPDLSKIPAVIQPWLAAMLEPDPARRPANLDELLIRWPAVTHLRPGVAAGVKKPAGGAKARSGVIIAVAAVLAVLAVGAVLALWLVPRQPTNADEQAFQVARDGNTEAAYGAYLATCAAHGCVHEAQARQQLSALSAAREAAQRPTADDRAFQTALATNTEAAYQSYLSACPATGCGHQAEALQHLSDLAAQRATRERGERERLGQTPAERQAAAERQGADDRAFKIARWAKTEAAYRTYLDGCVANGCGHQAEAQEALDALVVDREAHERAERERLAQGATERQAAAGREAVERQAVAEREAAERQAAAEREANARRAAAERQTAERQAADDRAMSTAQAANTEAAYRAYLDACAANGCGHQEAAQKSLDELAAQRAAREREGFAQAAAEREAAAQRQGAADPSDRKKVQVQLAAAQKFMEKRNIVAARRALDEVKGLDRAGAVDAFRQQQTVILQAAARAFLEHRHSELAKQILDDLTKWDPQAPETQELRDRLANQH
ncbi:protein kinase [uncultured Thiodictyon sp.]|uniref:protein kinase domain-containing protein n=1 Tax=uncultured Thiodictyon sp. TaxID=1846217 RepID=UPI0025CCAF87|nr:protein kinase [uncultured Thiodictyon sp.]